MWKLPVLFGIKSPAVPWLCGDSAEVKTWELCATVTTAILNPMRAGLTLEIDALNKFYGT